MKCSIKGENGEICCLWETSPESNTVLEDVACLVESDGAFYLPYEGRYYDYDSYFTCCVFADINE